MNNTYKNRVENNTFLHKDKLIKLYFVRDGKRIDRLKTIGQGQKNKFGNFERNMDVIFSQRVFNLNYRHERLMRIKYLINLEAINEKYSEAIHNSKSIVVCNSLFYERKHETYIDQAMKEYDALVRDLNNIEI